MIWFGSLKLWGFEYGLRVQACRPSGLASSAEYPVKGDLEWRGLVFRPA